MRQREFIGQFLSRRMADVTVHSFQTLLADLATYCRNADNLSEADKFLVERNRRFHEAGDAIETLLLGHNAANANNASIAVGLGTSQVEASIDGRAYFGNPKSWYDQAKELWGLQHRRGSGVAGRP
jgi:hypothetical protein